MTRNEEERMERPRNAAVEVIYVLFVLGLLLASGLTTFFPDAIPAARASHAEANTPPAPLPSLDPGELVAFPAEFRGWFGAHYGFQSTYRRLHARLWVEALGTSPDDVFVVSPSGWLFTTTQRTLDDLRGVHPIAEDSLEDWRLTLEARRDWLASRGIEYAFIVPATKNFVYPELLPPGYEPGETSRRGQFLEYMHEHSDVHIIDLLPSVLDAKQDDEPGDHAYFPLGTHWTTRGAYHGYVAILDELRAAFPRLEPWPTSDLRTIPEEKDDNNAGDLFARDFLTQSELRVVPRPKRPSKLVRGKLYTVGNGIRLWRQADATLPRAVLVHDSFGTAIIPFLAQHFSELHLVLSDFFPSSVIEREQPRLVMELYVDRFTSRVEPTLQTVFDAEEIQRRFAASNQVLMAGPRAGEHPHVTGYQGSVVSAGAGGVPVLHLESRAQGILLDEVAAVERGRVAVLRIVFDAPEQTRADVFYDNLNPPGYSFQRSEGFRVEQGRNELYIPLSPPALSGRALFRPGLTSGNYAIHAIEVRAIDR